MHRRREERLSAKRENKANHASAEFAVSRAVASGNIAGMSSASGVEVPFEMKPSHKIVLCGGYAGCLKCGSVVSQSTATNALGQECKGHCPRGSRGAVRRLAKGLHPRRPRDEWPNGEEAPHPKRLKVNV